MASARRMTHSRAMIVSDLETRVNAQYTLDTLRILKAHFPGVHFVWLMGADNLSSFHRWKGWVEIMNEVPVAVVSRPWAGLKKPLRPRRPPLRRLSLALRAGPALALRQAAGLGLFPGAFELQLLHRSARPAEEGGDGDWGVTAGWRFWIDRGGTFTDIVAERPDGEIVVHKLLSENPERYADAAVQGIRTLLGVPHGPIHPGLIAEVKIGTTVATNALLERKGERTLLAITRGFKDALRIGYQNRPKLFDRQIVLPSMLYEQAVEIEERVTAEGEILTSLDEAQARAALQAAFEAGIRAVAIVFMHAYRHPAHEARAAEIARDVGFTQVSTSHETAALMKLVGRGDTTVADAYLSPILRRYVDQVANDLGPDVPLSFMQSSGGLIAADRFQGKDSILSGPAGGIVGMARTAKSAGFDQASSASTWAAHRPTSPTTPGHTNAVVRDHGGGRAPARADDEHPHRSGRRRLDLPIRRRTLSGRA